MRKNGSRITIFLGLIAVSSLLAFIQPALAQKTIFPNNTCADCHLRLNMTISSTYEDWSKSIHFLYGVTCDKCHGGNASAVTKEETHTDFTNGTFSNGSIARANTPEICGKCHSLQLAEFKMSKHYHILTSAGEKRNAPACITCHQAHSIHVLAASEIVNFCGNCHNNKTGINPSVPKRAEAALNSVYELRVEISKAQSDIRSANASGRDVIEAQEEVNTAKTILKDTASVWHRFNLTYFETDVQQGLDDAKNAQNITAEIPAITMPAKAPGFEGILFIFGLVIAYFMFSKRNSR